MPRIKVLDRDGPKQNEEGRSYYRVRVQMPDGGDVEGTQKGWRSVSRRLGETMAPGVVGHVTVDQGRWMSFEPESDAAPVPEPASVSIAERPQGKPALRDVPIDTRGASIEAQVALKEAWAAAVQMASETEEVKRLVRDFYWYNVQLLRECRDKGPQDALFPQDEVSQPVLRRGRKALEVAS